MESAEVEVGALHIQRPVIDFASQMESLNRMNKFNNSSDVFVSNDACSRTMQLTKSQKELRMINRNRNALNKRNKMLASQNVDIESSFASSRLPEDKRSIGK